VLPHVAVERDRVEIKTHQPILAFPRNSTPASDRNQVGAAERSIEAVYRPNWTNTNVTEMLFVELL
jgi:hypothetical protein